VVAKALVARPAGAAWCSWSACDGDRCGQFNKGCVSSRRAAEAPSGVGDRKGSDGGELGEVRGWWGGGGGGLVALGDGDGCPLPLGHIPNPYIPPPPPAHNFIVWRGRLHEDGAPAGGWEVRGEWGGAPNLNSRMISWNAS
jgi:hypothetical protein